MKSKKKKSFCRLAFALVATAVFVSQVPGAYADTYYPPTLDKTQAAGITTVGSGYTLTPTENTSGSDIINIPTYNTTDKELTNNYYEIGYKESVDFTHSRVKITDTNYQDYNYYINNAIWSGDDTLEGGGAAIRTNNAKINSIVGDFINNSSSHIYGGGAMSLKKSTINFIIGDFIGNKTTSENGGAVNIADSTLTTLTGSFINNYAKVDGGAMLIKNSKITTLNSNFIGNTADSLGGAIYRMSGSVTTINGDFINNTAGSGGAIYSSDTAAGTFANINSNFVGNTATNGSGGAIYNANKSTITNLTGDFVDNHSTDSGGAIYNKGTIGTIGASSKGYFGGNYTENDTVSGGAIYNTGTIGTINADFIENYANGSSTNNAYGGAIYNSGTITTIDGDFEGNYANIGGAISNIGSGNITTISGSFTGNYTTNSGQNKGYGGAIYNQGTIGSVIADFTGNYGLNRGGAICNQNGTINSLVGDFIGNHSVGEGGAVDNAGNSPVINNITGDFIGNYSNKAGGAFKNTGTLKFVSTADRGVNFTGNYVQVGSNPADSNAIYSDKNSAKIYFDANPANNIVINDKITTASGVTSTIYINSEGGTGTVEINNSVTGYNTSLYGGTLRIGTHTYTSEESSIFAGQTGLGLLPNLTVVSSGNSKTLSTIDDGIRNNYVTSLTMNDDLNWGFDADLSSLTTDTISASAMTTNGNNIIINAINVIADSNAENTYVTLTDNAAYAGLYTLSNAIIGEVIEGVDNYYLVDYSDFGYWTDGTASGLDADKGILQFTKYENTLAFQVRRNAQNKTYTMSKVENVLEDLGTLNGSTLVVDGGGYAVNGTADEVSYEGITLGDGVTQSLTIDNVSSFNGFGTTAITNKANGTLIISNSTFENNTTADIDNSGTFKLSGTNSFEKIIGSGTMEITSGTTTVGSLEQGILTVTAGTLTNNGNSTIGGGSNAGIINGLGSLTNTGTFTNSNSIINTVINSGTFTNSGSGITGNVTNSGTFANNAAINGTLTITGGTFTNNANITGAVNNGGTLTTSANYLGSTITNTNTLNLTGTLAQNVLGNGTTNVNSTLTMNSGAGVAGTLNLNGGSVIVSNGEITSHNLGALTGTGNLSIDLNATAGTADSFNITNATGSGTATISAINLLGEQTVIDNLSDFEIQILNGGNTNLDVTQALKDAYYKSTLDTRDEPLTASVAWNKVFHVQERDIIRELSVIKSSGSSVYDTLVLATTPTEWTDTGTVLGDTLDLINNYDITDEKNFNFDSGDETNQYELSVDLSETKGTLNINGTNNTRSIIDMNSHKGFTLGNNTTKLKLDKVKITGANTTANGAVINATSTSTTTKAVISDSTIQSNTATGNGGAIYNALTGVQDNYSGITVTNSSFTSNSAANGGAIYNAGTIDISGTSFTSNSATEGSAIYNTGTAKLTNSIFTTNSGNSYLYNAAGGNLSLIAEQITSTAVNNHSIDNGNTALIKNAGILNLAANTGSTLTVGDAIHSVTDSAKGTINTNGTVAINDSVINQILNVVTGQLTIGQTGSDVSDMLQNVDLTVNSGTTATINNKNIAGGTIVNKNILNIVNNSAITISAQLSDSGIINKSGTGKTTFNGDKNNSGFSGTINITDGTVSFETLGANFVSKDADINVKGGSILEYIAKDSSYTFGDNTFADVVFDGEGNSIIISGLGRGNSDYILNSDWITLNSNSNNLTFKNSNYELNSNFDKNSGASDNITFDSSGITLGSGISSAQSQTHSGAKDYDMGCANYSIVNSYLDLSDRTAGDNYEFNSLAFSNGSTFSLDVDLVLDTASQITPYSDTITANAGSGIVTLTKLFITDDNGIFDSNNSKGIIQIFNGNNDLQVATQDNMTILSWATNVYKYGVTSASTEHEADSIEITAQGISSTDTLRDLNRYMLNVGGGNRGFSFIAKDGLQENNKYNIYRDLDTTSAKSFTVVGTLINGQKSLLDGTLKPLELLASDSANLIDNGDGTWTYNGEIISGDYVHVVNDIQTFNGTESGYRIDVAAFTPAGQTQGSMFELVNATDFEMTNVSVENAKRYSTDTIKDGSVIYANNASATVTLNNVDFKNDSVDGGNGGAIANLNSSVFSLINSEITGNTASGNGGTIYNTSTGTMSLQNVSAYGNQSTNGLGGAIYTSTNMSITDSNFGVGTLNTDKNGQNDIYIAGTNTVLTFNTSENTVSTINSGIAGDGTLLKTGVGTLNLGGKNAGLTGVLAINGGTINYTANDENDTFVSGSVQIAEGSTLIMDISATGVPTQNINNVDGYTIGQNKTSGSIVKKGAGTLNLGGNNSGFTGTTTIKGGSLVYTADENTDRYFGGSTVIGDSENPDNTANLTLNIGDVENQTISNISSATTTVNDKHTITKTGAGDIVLSGDNSGFYGQTTIGAGSLIYKPESANDKYFSGNTVISTSGTLETQVTNAIANQTIGNISGTGNFVINNEYTDADTQGRIQLVGTNAFTGLTDIQKGILAYTNNNGNFVSGAVNIAATGALEYTAANNGDFSNTLTGSGTFDKLGSGTLTVKGDESAFAGKVDINAGTLAYNTSNGKLFGPSSTYEISDGATFDITTNNDSDNVTIQNVSSEGSNNTAAINKNGVGTLTLNGNNSGYSGNLNITGGKVSYENKTGNTYIAGATSIFGSAALDYIATAAGTLTNVSGTGTLNKSGSANLTFNETDNTNFTGTANITAGTLSVQGADSATDFGFNTVISGGILDYTAGTGSSLTIGGSKVAFAENSSGTANFTGQGTANTTFTLGSISNMNNNTTVNISNSTLKLAQNDYSAGKYSISNSIIDLIDNGTSTITFGDLTVSGTTKLNIDVDLGPLSDTPASDVLNVNSGSGTVSIALNTINVLNATNNNDDGISQPYTFNVITGNNNLVLSAEDSVTYWSTDVYQYLVNITDDNKGIIMQAVSAADNNSLKVMNNYVGNRGFQFTQNDDNPYIIAESLGETGAGTFNVIGTGSTVVSGEDANGDAAHSFFEVVNDTDLTVQDLTITKAAGDEGSALLINNEDANVVLDDVNITDSASTGDGGAISNKDSNTLTVNGGTFSGNTAGGNGGVLNNTSSGSTILQNINAYGNQSTNGLGGAIYTNTNITIADSDFGIDEQGNIAVNTDKNGQNDIYVDNGATVTIATNQSNSTINSGVAGSGNIDKTGSNTLNLSGNNEGFTGDLNVTQGNVNYTQNTENDTYISGKTNIYEDSSVTLNNDISDNTVGEFAGSGTLNKTGSKDITLSGDNSGFTGDVNIQNGSVIYNADNGTTYFGGNTNLADDGGLVVQTNNEAAVSNISGTGTITKDGSGSMTLGGDNSGFTGNLDMQGGALNISAGANTGKINNGTFAGGTSINLQNTSVVRNPDGTYSTDPNPASIETLSFNSLVINGKVNFSIDVDLENGNADSIQADNISGNGYLSIGRGGLNVVTDALLHNTSVQIATGALAEGDLIRLEADAQNVMGPIQRYSVNYSGGSLSFTAQKNSFNPAVMASSVATQIGGFLTQSQTLQDGFFHMNRYTKYTRADRMAAENANKYAIESGEMPLQDAQLPEVSQGMWIKPYATFEKVNLRGGYKVENFAYGALYGGDSDMVDMGSGWKGVLSAFVGYNGNHMNYNGISMDMQGGTLGATGTLYKGNFFTGLTVSTGASAGEAYTRYGTDNFSMLTAGIANKTGYNWEINGGKLIIQPSLFTGYTFVNTFDYTNAAGVRIDSDPLHAIQIIPGVKIIGNLPNGWQPYAGVDMVWNIMDSNRVMANDVKLPQLSVKPYVQYGVGVQKSWSERFTAFFQTMLRGGGRNGVALTAGFRWTFGKDKPEDKNYVPVKKVVKKAK